MACNWPRGQESEWVRLRKWIEAVNGPAARAATLHPAGVVVTVVLPDDVETNHLLDLSMIGPTQ